MTIPLANILDALPLAISVKDADGRYLLVNTTFAKWFSVAASSLTGLRDEDCFEGELLRWFQRLRGEALHGATEVMAQRSAADEIDLSAGLDPVTSDGLSLVGRTLPVSGPSSGIVTIIEPAGVQAVDDQWRSPLSHDLRTPLNAMAGWVHLLELGVQGAAFDKALGGLQRGIEEQKRLVDGITSTRRIP